METGVSYAGLLVKAAVEISGATALLLRRQPQHFLLVLFEGLQGVGEMHQPGALEGALHILKGYGFGGALFCGEAGPLEEIYPHPQVPGGLGEVHHAREEGVEFKMLCSPAEIVGRDGWVTGMTTSRMELGPPDASGRRSPVCVMGSEFTIDCDTVIVALGTRANPVLTSSAPDLALTSRGYIEAADDGATSIPGVYAGGDIVTGSATVISALGAGRKAAQAIHIYLSTVS